MNRQQKILVSAAVALGLLGLFVSDAWLTGDAQTFGILCSLDLLIVALIVDARARTRATDHRLTIAGLLQNHSRRKPFRRPFNS